MLAVLVGILIVILVVIIIINLIGVAIGSCALAAENAAESLCWLARYPLAALPFIVVFGYVFVMIFFDLR